MKNNDLVYRKSMDKKEVSRILKAIGFPLLVFALNLYTISNFAAFGTKLICPLTSAMWIVGVVVAFLMPSMRKETLNQTLIVCTTYCAALLGLKMILGVVSGVSSEMIAASYNQAIPTSTGNAIPGYLQTMMWFTAVGVPLGNIGMQGKRLLNFKKSQSIQKTYGQVRNMARTNKDHTEVKKF